MVLSAKEAIKKYYVELLDKLPLDDEKFFGMVKGADLFPLDTGDNIKAKPTRAGKVAYFLERVIEPGADLYLPRLLTVMKESKVVVLMKLAEERSYNGIRYVYSICTPHYQAIYIYIRSLRCKDAYFKFL